MMLAAYPIHSLEGMPPAAVVLFVGALFFSIVLGLIVRFRQRHRARVRLKQIDAGKRCMSCDSMHMETRDGQARCLDCGYAIDLAKVRAVAVTDAAVEQLMNSRRY
jgi:hypothetical protein